MSMPPTPDSLEAALEELRPAPLAPPSLRREVWQRIAATEFLIPEIPPWPARLVTAFTRPSFAAAFVAACMLLGLFLAEWRIARTESTRSREIARSYLALIDPLLLASNTDPNRPLPR